MTTHMPFLMPDGSRLSSLLSDENAGNKRENRNKSRGKKGRGGSRLNSTNTFMATRPQGHPQSDVERAELAAADKLGARRRLRYLNDKLLREMAGPMTAQDMAGLFSPAPFGEHKVSPLQKALVEAPRIWDQFRNIDMDKQDKVLQKWEEHVRESNRDSGSRGRDASDASVAIQGWQRVGRKKRLALQKIDIHYVHEVEEQFQSFVLSNEKQMLLPSVDAFERLGMHGLAAFYDLLSHSVDTPSGKAVRVTRPLEKRINPSQSTPGAVLVNTSTPISDDASTPDSAVGMEHTNESRAGTPIDSWVVGDDDVSGDQSSESVTRLPVFTAVDVLMVLQDNEPLTCLTTSLLEEHWRDHVPLDYVYV